MLNFGFLIKNSKIKHLCLKIKKYKVNIRRYDVFLYIEQVYLERKDKIS